MSSPIVSAIPKISYEIKHYFPEIRYSKMLDKNMKFYRYN